jgi:hypothetical protein
MSSIPDKPRLKIDGRIFHHGHRITSIVPEKSILFNQNMRLIVTKSLNLSLTANFRDWIGRGPRGRIRCPHGPIRQYDGRKPRTPRTSALALPILPGFPFGSCENKNV